MKNPPVIIVLLNYNQTQYTIDCIESILMSTYLYFSIIVIDNGSDMNNYDLLKTYIINRNEHRLQLKRIDSNVGYVGGINLGLKTAVHSDCEYILIMNNDTRIHSEAISKLINTCRQSNNRAIVTGMVYWFDEPQKIQNTGIKFNKFNKSPKPIGLNEIDIGQFNTIVERDMIDDIFWLFPKKLISEIGYYSEYFWFNFEQADFGMRAKRKGYKLLFTPDAKLWHKSGVTIGGREENPVKLYYGIQGKLIYYYRNFPIYEFSKLYAIILMKTVFNLIKSLRDKRLYKTVKAYYAGISYFNRWIIKKNNNNGYIPKYLKN